MKTNAHRFAKRDSNHEDIVRTYQAMACTVLDLSAVGFGCPDTLIGCITPSGRRMDLVEIKSEEGKLTAAQERFNRDWRGPPARIIRSCEEAVKHVQELRGK